MVIFRISPLGVTSYFYQVVAAFAVAAAIVALLVELIFPCLSQGRCHFVVIVILFLFVGQSISLWKF